MAKGKVRSYDEERGFGFIRSPEASDDVFFHFKDVVVGGEDGDFDGATVEFTLAEGERGPKASNVKIESRRSGGAPAAAERRPAQSSSNRPVSLREFRREVTEILLNVDGIGSSQIRTVRDFLTDYGLDRGFVVEDTRR